MKKPKLTEEEKKKKNRDWAREYRKKMRADPEYVAEQKAKAKARLEKKMADPEYVIRKREADRASKGRYRRNRPDRIRLSKAKSRQKNRKRIAEGEAKYRQRVKADPILLAAQQKRDREYLSRPEVRERKREIARAVRTKQRQDPAFILLRRIRSRTRKICRLFKLGNIPKVNKERFVDYFGTAPEVVVAHIESQFTSGMTWESYDKTWHIDHIIPISAWNGDKNLLVRLNHYKNLRPLLAAENIRKGDKMPDFFPEGVPFTPEECGWLPPEARQPTVEAVQGAAGVSGAVG